MSASRRVMINTGILYARMVITVFLSLYTTRVTLQALGVEDFGIFNLVGGAIAMLTFLNTSMAVASQRFMSFAQGQGDGQRQSSIFNVSAVLHLIIAFVVLALLEGVGFVLFNGTLKIANARMDAAWMVYQFAAISTFFTIISVPYDAVINARENMFLFAVLGVVEAIIKLLIALFIVGVAGDKLMTYGALTASMAVLLLFVRAIYCHSKYKECVINPREFFDKKLFREMTSFAGWSFLGVSTGMIAFYGQGIVLNTFFGTVVNAAHGISGQVSGQLGAFATTMLRALNPLIAKSEGAGNRELMLKASMLGCKMSFFLLMFFYVPVLIEMPFIFEIWLKSVPAFTVIFCRLLLIRNLVEQLYVTLAGAISAVGDIRKYQIVMSVVNLAPMLASYYLFSLGCEAATLYLCYLAYSVVSMGITLWFANVKCELNVVMYLKETVLRCMSAFLVSICVTAVCAGLITEGFERLLVTILVGVASFGACFWFIGLSKDERFFIKAAFEGLALRKRIAGWL